MLSFLLTFDFFFFIIHAIPCALGGVTVRLIDYLLRNVFIVLLLCCSMRAKFENLKFFAVWNFLLFFNVSNLSKNYEKNKIFKNNVILKR